MLSTAIARDLRGFMKRVAEQGFRSGPRAVLPSIKVKIPALVQNRKVDLLSRRMCTTIHQIPRVNLQDFTQGTLSQRAQFLGHMDRACEEMGFFRVEGHGISLECLGKLRNAAKKVFALPDEVKNKYSSNDVRGVGYRSRYKQLAEDLDNLPEITEYFYVRPKGANPPNKCPKEVPEFEEIIDELWRELTPVYTALLRASALCLKETDEEIFVKLVKNSSHSVMCVTHYPCLGSPGVPDESIWMRTHTDFKPFTFNLPADREGLQMKLRNGPWLPIPCDDPGQLIVNIGNWFATRTKGRWRAVPHWVVNPPDGNTERFSFPVFIGPEENV